MFKVYHPFDRNLAHTEQVCVGDDTFLRYTIEKIDLPKMRNELSSERLLRMSRYTKQLPPQEIFGYFYDECHYYKVMQLISGVSDETRCQLSFFQKYIIPKLTRAQSALDIGIGHHARLSELLQRYLKKTTFVDSNEYAIRKAHQALCTSKKSSPKPELMNSNILDLDLSALSCNLIVLSHVLYYHDASEQLEMVHNVYNSLVSGGKAVFILSSGLDKDRVIIDFNGKVADFNVLVEQCKRKLNCRINIYYSKSRMAVPDKTTLLHVMGLWLHNGGVFVTKNDLNNYLQCEPGDGHYEMHTNQTFLVLTKN